MKMQSDQAIAYHNYENIISKKNKTAAIMAKFGFLDILDKMEVNTVLQKARQYQPLVNKFFEH